MADQVEACRSKPKHEAKKSRHKKKTKSMCTPINDETVNTEPEEQKEQPREDFSWLGEHCQSLDENVLCDLEKSEEEGVGLAHKDEYEDVRNMLELKEKELKHHYKSVDDMAKEKAREMKDLIYSLEDIKNSEVKQGMRKLEIDKQIRQLETELKAIKIKDNIEKEAKGKLENEKKKLEEFMDIFRKEAMETAAVFQTEIQTLKGSLEKIQQNVLTVKSEPKRLVANAEHILIQFIESEIEDLEKELECPVCFNLASSPIFKCEDDHLICSSCKVKLRSCPQCREDYPTGGARRFRGAERQAEKLEEKKNKLMAFK